MNNLNTPLPLWTTLTLKAIAAVDLAAGFAFLAAPAVMAASIGAAPSPSFLLQIVGLQTMAMGAYLFVAALDPLRHWPATAMALAMKTCLPALYLAGGGAAAPLLLVPAFVLWWVPLGLVAWNLIDANARAAQRRVQELPSPSALMEVTYDQKGNTLRALTDQRPQLVVFLRHFGCTFCRETLADLVDRRHDIQAHGLGIVLIHMASEEEAAPFMEHYGLDDVPRISDPSQQLYRAARLNRGSLMQLFGPKVWLRGLFGGRLREHGIGRFLGDGFQMPGAFVIHHGEVLYAFRHRSAADRPDYLELARCGIQQAA